MCGFVFIVNVTATTTIYLYWHTLSLLGALPIWQSAAEAGQRAVGADHTMAGNDDRDRVASVRRAHRAHRLRLADAARDVAVAPGLPVGNLRQRRPDLALARRADRLQRPLDRKRVR